MNGNVWEWCDPVQVSILLTEQDTTVFHHSALRGGGWGSGLSVCSSIYADTAGSYLNHPQVGFRLVREPHFLSVIENSWAVFAEAGLSIGGISKSFNDNGIQQFGYNVKVGYESDGSYLRLGAGRQHRYRLENRHCRRQYLPHCCRNLHAVLRKHGSGY